MAKVFICYRRVKPDQEVASYLYNHLSKLGHNVFIDYEGIRPGEYWNQKIQRNLSSSSYFIALVSSTSLHSDYIIKEELSKAAELFYNQVIKKIYIVNLAYDGNPPESVKPILEEIQFIKWLSLMDTLST